MRTRNTTSRAPTIRYVFKDGPITIKNAKEADPQRIGEALAAIGAAAGGRISTRSAVDAARDPHHPMHKHLEWDDAIAADAHRMDQAREIIRIIRIVDDDAETESDPPAFLSVNEGKAGVSYRTYGDVLDSVTLQDAVLRAAERDLKAFEDRYKRLEDICEIVRAARERIAARRTAQPARPEARPRA